MQIIDKRAYKPLCMFCHDSGCPLCEPIRAEAFAARLEENEVESLQQEVMQYVEARLGTDRGNYIEIKLPRTSAELCDLVMDAMLHGMERERMKRRVLPLPEFDPLHERFDRLEM